MTGRDRPDDPRFPDPAEDPDEEPSHDGAGEGER